MPISRRRFVSGLLAAPVLAACGGGDEGGSSTTGSPTTEGTPETTAGQTTTAPPTAPTLPAGLAPLTGRPADPSLLGRPALVVKIDNADGPGGRARPQSGLVEADVVFEEMVEGSVTRFAAVFHAGDAGTLGPVRSARETDIEIVSGLNRPLFAWSGGNAHVAARIRGSNLIDVGFDVRSGAYHRRGDRRAPYNLYSSTPQLFALAPADAAPPPQLFPFREDGQPPTGGEPSGGVHVEYRNPDGLVAALAPVDHRWDPGLGGYVRTQRGTPHTDEAGNAIAPQNVIVQFVDYRPDGSTDSAGNRVFIAGLVGEGEAWIFTGGNRVVGRWHKPAPEAVTAYTDASGNAVPLTRGQTYVLLPPVGGASPL